MPAALLTASDDSDDGVLERRPPRRRFFQKSETRGSRRFLLDVSFCHCLLLCILSLSLIYVAINTYSLTKHYAELQESVASRFYLNLRIFVKSKTDARLPTGMPTSSIKTS
ncbi:hypothetical protein GCK32_009195 [Trichostrongylus colubriformis]|uniref:Uncharacterized protein n=1 Tax=Trichostrongylus colubriformis TaxID=6319 RepID=A0AAN8FNW1_TRICO